MRNIIMVFLLNLLCVTTALSQVQKVTGKVLSQEDQQPIVGASVLVEGTNLGSITNIDGIFTIEKVPTTAKHLKISYIGMKTTKVKIKNNLVVYLEPTAEMLDEVIVTTYGTSKKSSFTGAASTLGAKSIEKRPLTNVTNALEGNASGIQVTAAGGQPGESAAIRIRGFGSVNASNSPLYVLDGAIYNGSISDINPTDIESVTILKDAASTSLYGASAGNGVILITTKKGKEEGTNVNVSINQGWSKRAYDDYAKVGLSDYYPLQWEMLKNSYLTSGKSDEEARALATKNICTKKLIYNPYSGIEDDNIVGTDGTLNPNISSLKWGDDLDWNDAAYKTGYRQEYNMSYSSKSDKSNTFASLSYLNDKGYMIKTDFERYTGRINYNITPKKWFKSGFNLSASRVSSNYSTSDASNSSSYSNLTRFIRGMGPIYPIHKHNLQEGYYINSKGEKTTKPNEYLYDYAGDRPCNPGRHAIAETEYNKRELTRMSQNGRAYITITPIEGLELTANYSIENRDYRSSKYENPLVGDGTAGPGRLEKKSTNSLTQTLNQLINYKTQYDKHSFDVLLGHETYTYKYQYLRGMKIGETVTGLYEFGNFITVNALSSYTDEYKKEGYFGRFNYNYADKYYASLSYRHDGSSRFSEDNRWGDFWSLGLSWRLSEEDFIKEYDWIDNLKLRFSYGETGNDNILSDGSNDYYPYQTLYGLGYTNGNESGAYFTSIANDGIKWETQVSTDIAVEFKFFDALSGTIEYFRKDSKDLLFNVYKPYSTGVSSIIENIGKVRNYGIELDLTYDVIKNRDFRASISGNATFLRNKLKKLPNSMKDGYISGSKKWLEGKSMYEFWLRQWYGVNSENGDGLFYFDAEEYNEEKGTLTPAVKETIVRLDEKGNIIKPDDKETPVAKTLTNSYKYAKYDFSGRSIPSMYGGFNFNIGYKDFDLTAVFSYQLGGKILDLNYAGMMDMGEFGNSMSPDIKKAWREPGDKTSVPRLDNNSVHTSSVGTSYSTRWLTSSNYLNFRSVSLGYNMPKSLLKKISIKSARINLTAENLFLIKERQGLNPMSNYSGITYNEYMPTRNFTIGLNLSF